MYLGTNEKSENFKKACERSHVALCAKNEALPTPRVKLFVPLPFPHHSLHVHQALSCLN
jgi:hypothetical protein